MAQNGRAYEIMRRFEAQKDLDVQLIEPKNKLHLIEEKIYKNLAKARKRGAKIYNIKSTNVDFKTG